MRPLGDFDRDDTSCQLEGHIKFGRVTGPVALYPVASSSERVSFNILDREIDTCLRLEFVDSETDDVVTTPKELSIPTKIKTAPVMDMSLWAAKAVMSGRGDELIDVAKSRNRTYSQVRIFPGGQAEPSEVHIF